MRRAPASSAEHAASSARCPVRRTGCEHPDPQLGTSDSILSYAPANLSRSARAALAAAESRGAVRTVAEPAREPATGAFVWWPGGLPPGRRVAVISSRIERDQSRSALWRQLLRTFVEHCRPDDLLLAATGCTTAPWLERLATHAGRPLAMLHLPPARAGRRSWFESIARQCAKDELLRWPGYWIPGDGDPAEQAATASASVSTTPRADRWLIDSAELLLVLRLRRGSRVRPALQTCLDEPRGRLVLIAEGAGLVSARDAAELVERGARLWPITEAVRTSNTGNTTARADLIQQKANRVQAPVLAEPPGGRFLLHCTRRIDGPWPGQATAEYLDDLLFERPGADHSPRGALHRIVTEERIAASSLGIRGRHAVVCFTSVPLDQLGQLTSYRTHRVRWDFVPYGIAIDTDWLIKRGARPVIYGSDQDWATLPAELQPYFQRAHNRAAARSTVEVTEWTREQEWRHAGDVPLDELRAPQAFLFVPTQRDAEWLAAHSRWPIVVVPYGSRFQ